MNSAMDLLIAELARLPGIGPRTARRLVLHLLRNQEKTLPPLIHALTRANQEITHCTQCGNLDNRSPCRICTDEARDDSILCVVEDVADLWAIERSGAFRGRYHVLGGTLSAIDGRGPEALTVNALMKRMEAGIVRELVLALPATMAGQTTAHYVAERAHTMPVKITRLAQGIPIGGELDYLDDGTLTAALSSRLAY